MSEDVEGDGSGDGDENEDRDRDRDGDGDEGKNTRTCFNCFHVVFKFHRCAGKVTSSCKMKNPRHK